MPCLPRGAACDPEIMSRPGIIAEWHGVLADAAGQPLPGVVDAVARLARRGVPVVAVAHDDGHGDLAGVAGPLRPPVDRRERFLPPRPGLVLEAARRHDLRLPDCWLVGTSADHARAAAQAGCAGCVLIGVDPPTEDLGIVVARAGDLADAPRVMIPRGGGCWH
jgi:phosphoglycolate phosphatase-like HAD superfamily hydrolase